MMLQSSNVSSTDSTPGDSTQRRDVDGEQKGLAVICNGGVRKAQREGMEFPEDLVEMIIARMPFPSVFKARCLSRSWYFKFPLPSSSVRSLSPLVPQQIASVSHRWPIFCPVYTAEDSILGFERAIGQWQSMMTLSYLRASSWVPWLPMSSNGPLICTTTDRDSGYDVIVTNVITKSWKKLHEDDNGVLGFARILPLCEDGYRVFLVSRQDGDNKEVVRTQIYHSKLNTWTEAKKTALDFKWSFFDNSTFLDEKIYCMCRDDIKEPFQIWMYNLGDNTWTTIPHHFDSGSVINAAVLGCRDRIMIVVWYEIDLVGESVSHTSKGIVGIYELLPDSHQIKEVDVGPRNTILDVGAYYNSIHFASDADFIYFGQEVANTPVLTYNIRTLEWSCIPPATHGPRPSWRGITFEPGLNPFMPV